MSTDEATTSLGGGEDKSCAVCQEVEESKEQHSSGLEENDHMKIDSCIDDDPTLPSATPQRDYDPNKRVYRYEQLSVLDLVVHPIWIFDYVERRMRWANQAGLEMWNANSLADLQARSFQEMSDASAKRMEVYMQQFELGINVTDQWTNYPKGKATTCHMNVSGVKFAEDGDRMHFCIMCEGIPLMKEELIQANTRGVEMLRHLPVAVAQFDLEGRMMYQNPEASIPRMTKATATKTNPEGANKNILGGSQGLDTSSIHSLSNSQRSEASGSTSSERTPAHLAKALDRDFLERFYDRTMGEEALKEIQSPQTDKMDFEATINTRKGTKWCAIKLRKAKDPVTGESVILYIAADKTDAVRAREERKAREQKSEFLAIMAHEIRTPLHQVTGFIDLLDQTTLDTEQKSFVRLLKSSAQGLMTVISDVLDYSKLEAGKMKLESIPYEPLSVVEGSMAAVRSSCEEKGLTLELRWNKDTPFKVMGDPNRLRQILLNLLSNAVKFTKNGGITVSAKAIKGAHNITAPETSSMIRFEVADTGMGIGEENQKIIFRKYQQANASVARYFGGTGLGLSICKLLTENMGGQIGVESQLGKGTTFWVALPAKVPTDEHLSDILEDDPTEKFESLNILVAEDNKVNQKLLASMLKRMGHTSSLAMNGKEAIALLEDHEYDAVLME